MTTTYDTDPNTHTIAAGALPTVIGSADPTESLHAYYDDPDTYTISEAWASSPLGEPDDDISDSFESIEAVDEPKPTTNRATLAATLAAGIIGGATVGAVLFGYADPARPTFVVPWGAVKTSPSQGVQAPPTNPSAQPKPAGTTAPTLKLTEQAPAPKPIVSEPKTNQEVTPAPVDPGTPPVIAPPVIIDIPPLPPLHDQPETPETPPEPPKFDPPKIDVVQVPEADPEPPDEVLEVAPLDPSLLKPTVNGLNPIETGSRWTTNLPANKPPSRQMSEPSRTTLANQ